MKISKLINILNEYKEKCGEIEVIVCDEYDRYYLSKQNIWLNEYNNTELLILASK